MTVSLRRHPTVVDQDGARAQIRELVVDDAGTAAVVVALSDGALVAVPFELLAPDADGGYALPARWRQFAARTDDSVDIPVIAEQVTTAVHARPREQIRIRRRVRSEDKVVETSLWQEHLEVERVPVNGFVEAMPDVRREGDTLIVPCVEEVEVVVKRLRVREELRIRLTRTRHVDQQTVTLRRHEVDVEHSQHPKKHEGDPSS